MRLICGFVRLDGAPAEADALRRMFDALTSPGLSPRLASRTGGPAAIGLLDFSHGEASTLPGALPEGTDGAWLAADLRLDRPGDLSRALGYPFHASQEELALSALARWHQNVPDRLDGDFALAAWNPELRQLICARDIMGVRPLCYSYTPGRLLAFASLPRGLYESGLVARRLDAVALGRLLYESYHRNGLTGFEGIAWLPPGHSLVLTPNRMYLHRAWRPESAAVGTWRGSAAEAASEFRGLIENAVANRLPSAGPVAGHLSGGLDSSAIAVIAARQLRAQGRCLHAFSKLARPRIPALPDERVYVDAVLAQEPDLRWSAVHLPPLDDEGTFEPDFALSGPFAYADERICAAAATAGSGLLLSGAGGDEVATYNGLGILPALLREGRWESLYSELLARSRAQGGGMMNVAARQLFVPLLRGWLTAAGSRRFERSNGSRRRNSLSFLQPALAAKVEEALAPEVYFGSSSVDRVQWLAANQLADRAIRWSIHGARHGQAFSYPLADRRILEFGLSLPLERLVDSGFARQPFRNAMAGILPETIRWRRTKFTAFPDLEDNLRTALPALLSQVTAMRSHGLSDIVDLSAISSAFTAAADYPVTQTPVLLPNGQYQVPRPIRMAHHALRAFVIAQYVVRFGGMPVSRH